MSHKNKQKYIENDLENEIRCMDKLLEKDDYSQLKDSMDDKKSTLETQRNGWEGMWKGVGDTLGKNLDEM